MQIVLRTVTSDRIEVVLFAIVYAKILEEHLAVYLSAPSDDKRGPAEETPEGHAVRLDDKGRITHLTAINAKWLLDRDGEVVATLRDGRQLHDHQSLLRGRDRDVLR